MKIKIKKISYLFCLYFLVSVVQAQDINDFFFEEAQPRKEDVLAHFPKNMRGLYKSEKDSTRRLRITADSLIFEVPMVQYALTSQLAEKNYALRDTVLVNANGKVLPCLLRSDTVFFVDFAQSVYFVRSPQNIIKAVNNTYVLSKQVAENKWECTLLYKDNEKMCVAYFDFEKNMADVKSNKKIDVVKEGSAPYYLTTLRRKDFLKLVDKNYFPAKNYFYKRYDWQ